MKYPLAALALCLVAIVLWTTWSDAPPGHPAAAVPQEETGERGESEPGLEAGGLLQAPEQGRKEEPEVLDTPAQNSTSDISDPLADKYGTLGEEELEQAINDLTQEYWAWHGTEIERYIALGWLEDVTEEEATIREGDTTHDKIANIQTDGMTWQKIVLTRSDSEFLFALRDEFHWVWEKRHGTPHPDALR